MIYEMRTYHCEPQHIDRFLTRCEGLSKTLWTEHDIHLVGFWRTMIGPLMKVCYMLEWRDMLHYEAAWGAFQADERWITLKAETEAETGPWARSIENTFLRPADFSPIGGKTAGA